MAQRGHKKGSKIMSYDDATYFFNTYEKIIEVYKHIIKRRFKKALSLSEALLKEFGMTA